MAAGSFSFRSQLTSERGFVFRGKRDLSRRDGLSQAAAQPGIAPGVLRAQVSAIVRPLACGFCKDRLWIEDELEGVTCGNPTYDSSLVRRCHALRRRTNMGGRVGSATWATP